MMEKYLIIVDMQKDFIDGSLANADADKIVEPLCDYIKKFDGNIIVTLDTHNYNYLYTLEGKYLPIEHCIKGTSGWNLDDRIVEALKERRDDPATDSMVAEPIIIEKPTFGSLELGDILAKKLSLRLPDQCEILFAGTCTDICVITNALIVKTKLPNLKVKVLQNLCAGLNKEKHYAALSVMNSCQIEII